MMEEQGGMTEQPLLSNQSIRRRSRRRRSVYTRPVKKMRFLVAAVFVLLLAAGALYYRYLMSAQFAITLNGKPVVALATRLQCESVLTHLKQKYAPDVPQAVYFEQGELKVEPLKQSMPVTPAEKALAILSRQLTVRYEGVGIFVNRIPRVMLATKAEAVEAISLIQQQALLERPNTIPTFKERVVVNGYKQQPVDGKPAVPIMTPEQAARELTHPPRRQYATVGRGDSFYAIAMRHRLTVEVIKQWNPGINPGALQPGDQIRLPDLRAPLTVVCR